MLFLFAAPVLSCAAPTQALVEVYTEIPCDKDPEVGIAEGPLATLAEAPLVTSKRGCGAGETPLRRVGSAVIVPRDDKEATSYLRITTHKDGLSADACTPPDYRGCIVARWRIDFVPNKTQRVTINLRQACVDKPCLPTESCVNGACAPIDIRQDCVVGCSLEGLPFADAGTDSSVADASDGGATDAGPTSDVGDATPVVPLPTDVVAGSQVEIRPLADGRWVVLVKRGPATTPRTFLLYFDPTLTTIEASREVPTGYTLGTNGTEVATLEDVPTNGSTLLWVPGPTGATRQTSRTSGLNGANVNGVGFDGNLLGYAYLSSGNVVTFDGALIESGGLTPLPPLPIPGSNGTWINSAFGGGRFAVTWREGGSGYGAIVRRAAGGSTFELLVPRTSLCTDCLDVDPTPLEGGGFVMSWHTTTGTRIVRSRRYDANLAPTSPPVDALDGDVSFSRAVAVSSTRYVVLGQQRDRSALYARVFDAASDAPIGAPITIRGSGPAIPRFGAAGSAGRLAVVWHSAGALQVALLTP